jgi:hypothetical protein
MANTGQHKAKTIAAGNIHGPRFAKQLEDSGFIKGLYQKE